ncbi:MAG TPA: MmoB/DmpM family protein [Candidatus Competibacter phosphatis]|uniref:Monooxygenase n=1 Tax=Candidatus Competibacter phosphatis TaxID=221280 RepID=A0ABX1TG07_9GAMM|nr:MmoB/DmpM family protein [Candidatus Competibacter phosphatis]MCB1795403.1 MmoB/DmpM family protein [Candidatus Competibacteraceae bacterium]HPE71277.1 MmoB/DmpM family protein [Candidatus Competibacter sp.]NMQ18298.1 monooxygenase [Candidatus Competibacter phosphatis]HMQ12048.1 MmoB/DmpM family protein [Candidatus Competibacter phosphatis]HMR01974.1 MmoB/DmpM family protein [Candidatus Competibacter phosphatis]
MANNMVYLALQNNEDARPIIEAIAEDNPHATINHYPAMVKIDAPGRLTVKRASVEEKLGRDWDPQEIQINLISISGNVVESEEEFAVERLS